MTPMVRIRTLIVDDSAFARKVVREVLSSHAAIEVVGAARDGAEALDMVRSLGPDVVICDLQMPRLDGVEFVRRQMRERPVPILILSSASQDAVEVIEALDAGAVDVLQKPSALANDELRNIQTDLVTRVCAAVGSRPAAATATPLARPATPGVTRKVDVVVIGISTGGPQGLRRLVPALPKDFPVPVVIVLHMPVGYTALYAQKLNEISDIDVKEAVEGEEIQAGRVYIAPAGRHLHFRRGAPGRVVVQLSALPIDKIHRPSVDVLFRSAADIYRDRVLGVVMTGMGDDGREGSAWVKAQGGSVITEAEASCIIYGMPRSVDEAGLSDESVALGDMAARISSRI